MTVFDIPNVTVEVFSNMYRITAIDGYRIYITQHEELNYKKGVILPHNFNFETVEVISEVDIPESA